MVVDRNDELGQVLVRVAKVRFDHLGGPGDAFFRLQHLQRTLHAYRGEDLGS